MTKRNARSTRRKPQTSSPAQRKSRTASKRTLRSGPAAITPKLLRRVFSALSKSDGCASLMVVVERTAGKWEHKVQVGELKLSNSDRTSAGGVKRAVRNAPRACEALAAIGHPQRAKIMGKLLEGPGTYKSLQALTKCKAGPLYHHLNQLRLAGLILPKQRDLYELTRGGRNLILAAMVIDPLIRDKRRRPLAGDS